MSWDDADDIIVFSGSLPKGVSVAESKVIFNGDTAASDQKGTVTINNTHLPKGITISGGKAIVGPDFEYEILGEVHTDSNGGLGGLWDTHATPLYFYPYSEDEAWRNTFCHVQVPLVWVTLGIWTFVPTYIPCRTVDTNDPENVEDRKMRIVNTLKKATKALGVTCVLFLGQEPLLFKTTQGAAYNFGHGISAFSATTENKKIEWGQAWGLALRKKTNAAP
jgi:hypothetical protein